MRLYVTVDGRPAIIVGYAPGRGGPLAIVLGLADHPLAVPLADCQLPKLPKRLRRKILTYAKRETRSAQAELGGPH